MACVAETVIIILSPGSTLQRVTDCNRGYKYIDNIRIYMCVCIYTYTYIYIYIYIYVYMYILKRYIYCYRTLRRACMQEPVCSFFPEAYMYV